MHAIRVRVLRTDLYCACRVRIYLSFLSTIEVKSRSVEFISVIEAYHTHRGCAYADDLLPYVPFTMFSYWGCGESCLLESNFS